MSSSPSRRTLLRSAAGVGLFTLAGCGGSSGSTEDDPYGLITPGTLLAATSGDQPPFTMASAGGAPPTGFVIDLNEEVARRLGLKTSYTTSATASAIQGLTTGQWDMVAIGLGVTDERKKSVAFAKGEFWSTTAAVTLQQSTVDAMAELAGAHVAIVTGSSQAAYVKDIEGAVAVDFPSQNAAVSALTSGTVDAFLVGGPDAEEYLKQFPELKIAASQPVPHETTVAFGRENTALVEAYDEQLQALVTDGTFMTIYQRYFTEPPLPELVEIWPELGA